MARRPRHVIGAPPGGGGGRKKLKKSGRSTTRKSTYTRPKRPRPGSRRSRR